MTEVQGEAMKSMGEPEKYQSAIACGPEAGERREK